MQTFLWEALSLAVIVVGSLSGPVVLIWGWIKFARLPQLRTITSILSLLGLILTTASATLAVFMFVHAVRTGGYPYYDDRALHIYRWGMLLAVGGASLGIAGAFQRGLLRWQPPVSSMCLLVLWVMGALGE